MMNRILAVLLVALLLCTAVSTALAEADIAIETGEPEIISGDDVLEIDDIGVFDGALALDDSLDASVLESAAPENEETPAAANAYVAGNDGQNDFEIDGNGVLVKYNGPGGDVVIPKTVTSIGAEAFEYCTAMTSVTIPNTVKRIGDWAFHDCSGLEYVKIPNSVINIGRYAFSGCSLLTKIDLPYSITAIQHGTFNNCVSLTSMNLWGDVNIPSSVKSIGSDAFYNCDSMGNVTIPRSVKIIEDHAFYDCDKLIYVKVPSSVKVVGVSAFNDCNNLNQAVFYGEKATFGDYVFENCDNLTIYAFEDTNIFNTLLSRGYNVKKLSDNFLVMKGNTTKTVYAGSTIWIGLDGPKSQSFASSNNKIATVTSEGKVVLKKAGTVKITVTSTTGGKWVLTLKVIDDLAKLNKTAVSLKVGKSYTLKVTGTAGRKVTWSSSNNKIATVVNGKITAKGVGKCVIYAQVKNGKKLTCTVKVTR